MRLSIRYPTHIVHKILKMHRMHPMSIVVLEEIVQRWSTVSNINLRS
jgi:hypothetical protein